MSGQNTKKKASAPPSVRSIPATTPPPQPAATPLPTTLFTFKTAESITDFGDLFIELKPPDSTTSTTTIPSTSTDPKPKRHVYLVSSALLCMASPLFRSIPTVHSQATKPNGYIGPSTPHPAIILNFDLDPTSFQMVLEILHHKPNELHNDLRELDFSYLVRAARVAEKCQLKEALRGVFLPAVERYMDDGLELPRGFGVEARVYVGWVFGLPSLEVYRTKVLVQVAEVDEEGGLWFTREEDGKEVKARPLGYLPAKFLDTIKTKRLSAITALRHRFETLYTSYATDPTFSTCTAPDSEPAHKQQCHLQQLGDMALHVASQKLRDETFWRVSLRKIQRAFHERSVGGAGGHAACYWKGKMEEGVAGVLRGVEGFGYEGFA